MTGLLGGFRVLDASIWRPVPHATQILADLGAEVVKLEPPGGDPMRQYPGIFAGVAHGKRSVVIDLKQPEGRRRALELAAEADVFSEGFRPGVADRLGIGYDDVRQVNPSVVYCSISGFGQEGPYRDVPGHDLSYQALAGALVRKTTGEDGTPAVPTMPVADLAAGVFAATMVCAALVRRALTGEGELIDVAMADVIASWVGPTSDVELAEGEVTMSGSPGYGVFSTADGGHVALGTLTEQHLWDALCGGLGLGELAGIGFMERLGRSDEVNAQIGEQLALWDRDEAVERLLAAGAAVVPVLTPEEMAAHEQFRARGMVLSGGRHRVMALPAILAHHPRATNAAVPAMGEHPEGFSSGSPR